MHVIQHAAHAHAHAYDTREISFPRPVPYLSSQEGGLRFDSSVGGGRGTTFPARWKVCGSGDSSNSTPKPPFPGPPGTRSQHPPGLTGALTRFESGANCSGSIVYVPGLAADPASTAAGLSIGRRSSAREVRALRPRMVALT